MQNFYPLRVLTGTFERKNQHPERSTLDDLAASPLSTEMLTCGVREQNINRVTPSPLAMTESRERPQGVYQNGRTSHYAEEPIQMTSLVLGIG
jgi:hypothetical protein